MTVEDLDKTLEVLRKHGVASAEVPINAYAAPLRVVFEPSVGALPPGDPVTPGGWKAGNLDAGLDEVVP